MSSSLAEEATSERAFERLYRRHHGDVYRFVLRDVRDPEEAADVTQIAFLNAYRALKKGDAPDKPRAWLLTIAQNVARRNYRSRAVRPLEVELDPELVAAPEHEGPTGAEIRAALDRLRPNHRAVLVLREIGGLSYAETAETLGLSVSAVETLLFRARRALREELTRDEPERRVVVGGLVVWPLSELFSNPVGSLAMWLGRQGVAAKVAGLAGAVVVGTGAVVQTGVVELPPVARSTPNVEEPARVTGSTPRSAVKPRVGAGRVAQQKPKRAAAAPGAAAASGEPAAPKASEEESDASAVTESGVGLPRPDVLGVELPPAEEVVPETPQLPVPPLPVNPPEVEVPELETPPAPLPDTGEVLP